MSTITATASDTHELDCDCLRCQWAYDEAKDLELQDEYEN